MDLTFWKDAWAAFMATPVLILSIAFVAGAAAWWLRGAIDRGRIEALTERLHLARDKEKKFDTKFEELVRKVSTLIEQVESHPNKSPVVTDTGMALDSAKFARYELLEALSRNKFADF